MGLSGIDIDPYPRCLTRRLASLPNGTAGDAAVDGSLGHPIGTEKLHAQWVPASGWRACARVGGEYVFIKAKL
jgi:hypothetical protein